MTDNADSISQVYLQISPNILESFPKFRPPVDLYRFDPEVARVVKYHEAEERLGKTRQAHVAEYANEGLLFLLRDDYRVYARHLSKKLGLVLVEEDLSPQEVAEIFFIAFRDRMDVFLEQPNEASLKGLLKDLSIFGEYIWTDPCRTGDLCRAVHDEHDIAVHSVNTLFVGLGVMLMAARGKLKKEDMMNLSLGLLLHDVGMSSVPKFIRDKEQFLVRRDRDSIENHVEAGVQKVKRLGLSNPMVLHCVEQHHERLDGTGYPRRMSGKKISLPGRLTALADSYCAMVANRPHSSAQAQAEAAMMLAKDSKHYDAGLSKLLAVLVVKGYTDLSKAG